MGVCGQRRIPSALFLGITRCPLYRRLGGPYSEFGRLRKISPTLSGMRSPDLPARSESLYRPSYLIGMYEGHLESKERFAIKKYLLVIGKKQNKQVLSHTFTYFST